MKFLRASRQKNWRSFPCGLFFLVLQVNVYGSVLIPRKLPCPKKILVTRLSYRLYSKKRKPRKVGINKHAKFLIFLLILIKKILEVSDSSSWVLQYSYSLIKQRVKTRFNFNILLLSPWNTFLSLLCVQGTSLKVCLNYECIDD